jgi:hypothetical protein
MTLSTEHARLAILQRQRDTTVAPPMGTLNFTPRTYSTSFCHRRRSDPGTLENPIGHALQLTTQQIVFVALGHFQVQQTIP